MKYLSSYKIFETNGDLLDNYLTKLGTTRQDIIDIFQGVVDLGYEPKFKLVFTDKDGTSRKEKSSAEETPIVLISFKTDKVKYVGGSQRFSNLDYLESLYHGLSMFMSMFSDKCKVEYDIDNYVELEIRCQFKTEYDESKVSISKTDITGALRSCKDLVPEGYVVDIDTGTRSVTFTAKAQNSIGQRLLDQLHKSKTDKVVSNIDEVEDFGEAIAQKLGELLSKTGKDIRWVKAEGVEFFDAVSQLQKGSGLYLFKDGVKDQKIAKMRVTDFGTKNYDVKIKRGFFRVDECYIELESLQIVVEIL